MRAEEIKTFDRKINRVAITRAAALSIAITLIVISLLLNFDVSQKYIIYVLQYLVIISAYFTFFYARNCESKVIRLAANVLGIACILILAIMCAIFFMSFSVRVQTDFALRMIQAPQSLISILAIITTTFLVQGFEATVRRKAGVT
jgi:hypothetical protein